MILSRKLTRLTCAAVALIHFNFLFTGAYAQSSQSNLFADRERAIQLYRTGDFKNAVKALNSIVKKAKSDGEAWYYLGLALVSADQIKNARRAFESATNLRPDFAPAHTGYAYALLLTGGDAEAEREATKALALDGREAEAHYVLSILFLRRQDTDKAKESINTTLRLKPNLVSAYLLKSQVYLAVYSKRLVVSSRIISVPADPDSEERKRARQETQALLKVAVEALEKYLSLSAETENTATWREQLATLKVFAGDQSETVRSSEVTTRARVLSKPEPSYTERARNAGIVGTVILRAVFSSDAKVRHILVVRSLPYGLTEAAIGAARRIKFVPATKDGKPVSMFMQLEYNFNLY